MKIEWLDADCNRAQITRGLFRKKTAEVKRGSGYGSEWTYVTTGRTVEYYEWRSKLDRRRTRELWRRSRAKEWLPVVPLPKATIVR